MENKKVCKHFVNGNCKNGSSCEFSHIENICSHYFFGDCKFGDQCKQSHQYKLKSKDKKHKQKLIKKNTESFDPFFESGDMRIMIGDPTKPKYNHEIKSRDVILVNNLFGSDANGIYEKLINEIKNSGIDEAQLFKLWHGDTHMIADDHLQWKSKCPTFNMVIEKMKSYFSIDVKATRFNWFRDSSDFKPYHHDAAAVDPEKAKKQNFTVGVSFGATRTASFEHAKTRTVIDIPLENGSIYCFSKDTNIEWRHGIPRVSNPSNQGRISIIAWGFVNLI
jgi:hypothetical protein